MNEIIRMREEEALKGMNFLASTYYEFQERDKAVEILKKAVEISPKYFVIHNNLVHILNSMFKFEEALEYANLAIQHCPDVFHMYFNRGVTLCSLKRYEEGIEDYKKTIELNPEYGMAHYNLGFSCAMIGRYDEGLPELEWRFKAFDSIVKTRCRYASPDWDGSKLNDDEILLIYNEQGVGDLFHAARYFPLIKERVKHIILESQYDAAELMTQYKELDMVVPKIEGPDIRPAPSHHKKVSVYSLFNVFKTIPNAVPYLKCPYNPHFDRWLHTSKKKIGFAYAGNPIHQNDMHRSIPIIKFKQLAKPNVQFYNFQKDAGQRYYPDLGVIDYDKDKDQVPCIDLFPFIRNFTDTASIINKLDLVVTVDTALAHLAGAMGKPVFLLLPYAGDWRWGSCGETTPWYPSMRLFRQGSFRNWDEVFFQVQKEI